VNIRDRIKELRRVPADQLQPNPKNWRKHPESQANALRGVLAEVGIASAVLARETPEGGLMLIDGHLRTETLHNAEIPVLVLDVSEEEADKILATFDPLGAMAESDADALRALLEEVETGSQELADMLTALAEDAGVYAVPTDPANDANAEWQGMPEFEQEAVDDHAIKVYFPDIETKLRFSQLIGSTVTEETKFVWWPPESKPKRQGVDVIVVESES